MMKKNDCIAPAGLKRARPAFVGKSLCMIGFIIGKVIKKKNKLKFIKLYGSFGAIQ